MDNCSISNEKRNMDWDLTNREEKEKFVLRILKIENRKRNENPFLDMMNVSNFSSRFSRDQAKPNTRRYYCKSHFQFALPVPCRINTLLSSARRDVRNSNAKTLHPHLFIIHHIHRSIIVTSVVVGIIKASSSLRRRRAHLWF